MRREAREARVAPPRCGFAGEAIRCFFVTMTFTRRGSRARLPRAPAEPPANTRVDSSGGEAPRRSWLPGSGRRTDSRPGSTRSSFLAKPLTCGYSVSPGAAAGIANFGRVTTGMLADCAGNRLVRQRAGVDVPDPLRRPGGPAGPMSRWHATSVPSGLVVAMLLTSCGVKLPPCTRHPVSWSALPSCAVVADPQARVRLGLELVNPP